MLRRELGLRATLALALLPAIAPAVAATGLAAQEEETAVPGVPLGFVYENERVPPMAIRPFTGGGPASGVEAIIARDLDYSDRFVVMSNIPAGLEPEGIQYDLWDRHGADWLLTGTIENIGGGIFLEVELHDIVFASVQARGRFPLPAPTDAGFRMAVHSVSDAVVEWVTGDPGSAATRIVFSMRPFGNSEGKELYIVDSDGENLRRLTWDEDLAISPAWSPGGDRIAYTSYKSGIPRIYELDLVEGGERVLVPGNDGGQQFFPAYHPDGDEIAFTFMVSGSKGIFRYNVRDNCCLAQRTGAHYNDIQPTYSPDGLNMAFLSNRLGAATPQIYVMPSQSGDARLLSPYRFGEGGYFSDPDWSPISSKVAFVGGIVRRRVYNRYDIFVADTETGDSRLVRLTREGNNEDPSWAPDGRHIVFIGERSNGHGVFIVDSATGRTRTLVASVEAMDTDWSPPLSWSGAAGDVRGEPSAAGR